MNSDKLVQRLTLLVMCFCCTISVGGAVLLALQHVEIPDNLVEISVVLVSSIFAFLALSPLQK